MHTTDQSAQSQREGALLAEENFFTSFINVLKTQGFFFPDVLMSSQGAPGPKGEPGEKGLPVRK